MDIPSSQRVYRSRAFLILYLMEEQEFPTVWFWFAAHKPRCRRFVNSICASKGLAGVARERMPTDASGEVLHRCSPCNTERVCLLPTARRQCDDLLRHI